MSGSLGVFNRGAQSFYEEGVASLEVRNLGRQERGAIVAISRGRSSAFHWKHFSYLSGRKEAVGGFVADDRERDALFIDMKNLGFCDGRDERYPNKFKNPIQRLAYIGL